MPDSILSDLPSASEIGNSDLLYAVVDGISKKITKQVLLSAVTQVLTEKADLVQGILALSQMRENMKIVLNDTARFALTTNDVKNGFIIIVQQDEHGVPYSPNPKMYIVVDDTQLDEEAGYQAFASDVDWSTIENKPDNIVFSGPALATENVPAIDAYLHKSDVVNNFTDGGTEVPLSAECGKTLYSTLTGLTDVTGSFIVGTPSDNSAVYKNNKTVDGLMILTGVTIGVYNTLPASLKPKANRAVLDCYSFSTGALMPNLTCWILTDGTINFYGTAPGSTTKVAIRVNYLTV